MRAPAAPRRPPRSVSVLPRPHGDVLRVASYRKRYRADLAPQVSLSQILVLEQVGRFALQHDPAGGKDVSAVGDRERDIRVLLHDEDRDAGLVDLLDDLE